MRGFVLPYELAWHLKRKGYSFVWTQWPRNEEYGMRFWTACRLLRLPVVHTVHNVLPHEESPEDHALCQAVYKGSRRLVVHSRYAAEKLAGAFPGAAEKTILSRHGTYTTYPRMRETRAATRAALNLAPDQIAFLVFGAIRPYKNTETVLQAFQGLRSDKAVLVIAGRELGYPDLVAGDPLGRTAKLAAELGIQDRVRFLPGRHDIRETAEIFEAADALVLPYLESYGSGALLLGMTFDKHILATPTGGMDEYLEEYPGHTLLNGPGVDDLLAGMNAVIEKLRASGNEQRERIPSLEWKTIASQVITELSASR